MAELAGMRLLLFRAGSVSCATEATAVQEILSAQPVTRIPGASDVVPGIVNVRGTLITVVDTRRCLGQSASDRGESLVLLRTGGRTIGLVVDEVIDLVSFPRDGLAERDTLPGVEAQYVRAVGQLAGESFALLDTAGLLDDILPVKEGS